MKKREEPLRKSGGRGGKLQKTWLCKEIGNKGLSVNFWTWGRLKGGI